jgi:flagellar hook assembly protein FlgD
VHLAVFNVLGQKVRTLVDQDQFRGTHRVMWDGKDDSGNRLASGMYFYQLKGENALITKKMTLIK